MNDQSRDLEDSHIYLNNNDEELKNQHDDPIIREMMDEWEIANSFRQEEDNRAVTVHGKRSHHKAKKPSEIPLNI